jgi:hypothetical protein
LTLGKRLRFADLIRNKMPRFQTETLPAAR